MLGRGPDWWSAEAENDDGVEVEIEVSGVSIDDIGAAIIELLLPPEASHSIPPRLLGRRPSPPPAATRGDVPHGVDLVRNWGVCICWLLLG